MRNRSALLVLACLTGCSSSGKTREVAWTPTAATDLGAPVARVGEVPIYSRQVAAEARRQGISPRAALAYLVDEFLLAEVARKHEAWPPASSNLDDLSEAMVQRILEREFEPDLRPDKIPDSVLRPLYDRAKDVFVHPRLVDVAMLAIYTGALMKDAPRQERAQTAKELAAAVLKKKPKTLDEFMAIASEPEWHERHVVATKLTQGLDKPLSRPIGLEVAKLHDVGQMTPLMTDENGFFIARYVSDRPPKNVGFAEARPELADKYFDIWRRQRFMDFTGKLLQQHHVEAYYDRLPRSD